MTNAEDATLRIPKRHNFPFEAGLLEYYLNIYIYYIIIYYLYIFIYLSIYLVICLSNGIFRFSTCILIYC